MQQKRSSVQWLTNYNMSHPTSSGVYTVWGCVKSQKMHI